MVNQQTASADPVLALQALIMDPDLERLEDLLAEFNIFDVLKIERRELQHSALLAWLLNPSASHGLNDYFLRRFLTTAAAKAQDDGIIGITPLRVDAWKLADVEAATERHNIDILLTSVQDDFVCFIENKIGASEHSEQLERYLDTVEHEYQHNTTLPIFLTPDGIEPANQDTSERYVALGYQPIADIIDHILDTRNSNISSGIAQLLDQYSRTLRRHVMTDGDNIDALAMQIYHKHREAIDLIINAKPTFEAAGWEVLDSAVNVHGHLLKRDYDAKLYHRFYAPALDVVAELKRATGWTQSRRMILFEVRYRERTLAVVLGPGPQDTRQKVYDVAQDPDRIRDVAMRRTQKLSGKWQTIYRKSILPKDGSSEPDYLKGRDQAEHAIAEFVAKDYWPIVNAIRETFGYPAIAESR